MLALVLKTQNVVDIVEKRGDHYIDNNFNPYTKDELEFFIKQNYEKRKHVKSSDNDDDDNDEEQDEILGVEFNGKLISFEELNKLQETSNYVEKILWLAATVVEQHPDFSAAQVGMFAYTIYKVIKDKIRNEK